LRIRPAPVAVTTPVLRLRNVALRKHFASRLGSTAIRPAAREFARQSPPVRTTNERASRPPAPACKPRVVAVAGHAPAAESKARRALPAIVRRPRPPCRRQAPRPATVRWRQTSAFALRRRRRALTSRLRATTATVPRDRIASIARGALSLKPTTPQANCRNAARASARRRQPACQRLADQAWLSTFRLAGPLSYPMASNDNSHQAYSRNPSLARVINIASERRGNQQGHTHTDRDRANPPSGLAPTRHLGRHHWPSRRRNATRRSDPFPRNTRRSISCGRAVTSPLATTQLVTQHTDPDAAANDPSSLHAIHPVRAHVSAWCPPRARRGRRRHDAASSWAGSAVRGAAGAASGGLPSGRMRRPSRTLQSCARAAFHPGVAGNGPHVVDGPLHQHAFDTFRGAAQAGGARRGVWPAMGKHAIPSDDAGRVLDFTHEPSGWATSRAPQSTCTARAGTISLRAHTCDRLSSRDSASGTSEVSAVTHAAHDPCGRLLPAHATATRHSCLASPPRQRAARRARRRGAVAQASAQRRRAREIGRT